MSENQQNTVVLGFHSETPARTGRAIATQLLRAVVDFEPIGATSKGKWGIETTKKEPRAYWVNLGFSKLRGHALGTRALAIAVENDAQLVYFESDNL